MKLIILPEAENDLKDALVFYNDQLPKLGDQFYKEVLTAFDVILLFPAGWSKVGEHTRKFTLKRFPYLVLYIVEKDAIIITSIAHQHRHPDHYLKNKDL